jgi:23S rRNA G2069 N7-methylase RlmK/C1962 C5-methylase RlmI
MLRVRVLTGPLDSEFNSSVSEIVLSHLKRAIGGRKSLMLPSTTTDAYRLINGDPDGLSGLYVDVFNRNVIILSNAFWTEANRAIIESSVRQALIETLPNANIIWKQASSLALDGFYAIENEVNTDDSKPFQILENGVKFLVQQSGQKTGQFQFN